MKNAKYQRVIIQPKTHADCSSTRPRSSRNDYRKEEEGYRQHIKDIIREGLDKGGLLANSIEKEPKDPVPTRAASQTLEQVVSGNRAMPNGPAWKQAFPHRNARWVRYSLGAGNSGTRSDD